MVAQTGPLQIRRLSTAQLASVTPAAGEPIWETTTGSLKIGDGTTLTGRSLTLVASAVKLANARDITISGDATWTVSFDGSAAVSSALTLAETGVTAGTYGSVTVNTKGLVTGAAAATPIANGGTAATTAPAARTSLGLDFTAWTNLTLSNSWVTVAGRRTAYRSFLDMIQLEVNISSGTATDGTVLATLPVGFRPASATVIPVSSGPSTTPGPSVPGSRVLIGTDGTITLFNCTATPGLSFAVILSSS